MEMNYRKRFILFVLLLINITVNAVKNDFSELCIHSNIDRLKRNIEDPYCGDSKCIIIERDGRRDCRRCVADAFYNPDTRECEPCRGSYTNKEPNIRHRCKDKVVKNIEEPEILQISFQDNLTSSPSLHGGSPSNVTNATKTTPSTPPFQDETVPTVKSIEDLNKTIKNEKKPNVRDSSLRPTDLKEKKKKEDENTSSLNLSPGVITAIIAIIIAVVLIIMGVLCYNCFKKKKAKQGGNEDSNSGESNKMMLPDDNI